MIDIKQNMEKPIARGRTAEVFTWSENQVLKLFFDWMPLSSVQGEYEITRLAYQAGAPVPQVFDLIDMNARHGIIYELVSGPTMLKLLLSQPWQVKKLSQQLAEFHYAIHQIPLDGIASYRDRWFNQIERVDKISTEMKQRLKSCVMNIPEQNQLCHFDFHPDQIVYTQRGALILDWMTACRGDPAADVARTQLLLTVGKPPDSNWLLRFLADGLGRIANHYYQQRYFELNPAVTRTTVQAWLAPVAAVRLLEDIEFEAPILLKIINKFMSS